MDVYELDIDKFQTVLLVLSNLSNVVDNDVFKTTVSDKLVKKVNNINSNKPNLEKEMENVNKKMPDSSKFIAIEGFKTIKQTFIALLSFGG